MTQEHCVWPGADLHSITIVYTTHLLPNIQASVSIIEESFHIISHTYIYMYTKYCLCTPRLILPALGRHSSNEHAAIIPPWSAIIDPSLTLLLNHDENHRGFITHWVHHILERKDLFLQLLLRFTAWPTFMQLITSQTANSNCINVLGRIGLSLTPKTTEIMSPSFLGHNSFFSECCLHLWVSRRQNLTYFSLEIHIIPI